MQLSLNTQLFILEYVPLSKPSIAVANDQILYPKRKKDKKMFSDILK